jgi:predicted N-formylglutamate amidohydrolase
VNLNPSAAERLLAPGEPAPYNITPGRNLAWLLVCDHASNRMPAALGNMGISETDRYDHIAWDIGAAQVASRLAERLGAPLVSCNYSRLVFDCNRYPASPEATPSVSDGRLIAANQDIPSIERERRMAEVFIPYHRAVALLLENAMHAGHTPVVLSIHSCTPQLGSVVRPWEIGIGWSRDTRVARPMVTALRAVPGLIVGDNQPYSLEIGHDFTIPEHALSRGLAHLQVEFRNDLVATIAGAYRFADRFFAAMRSIADTASWNKPHYYLTAQDRSAGIGHAVEQFCRASL